jgi:uncharacterized membrane protein
MSHFYQSVGWAMLMVAVLAVVSLWAVAHEDEGENKVPGASSGVAIEERGGPLPAVGGAGSSGESEGAPFTIPPLAEAMFHHLHNKLVHLPYGLAVAALLLYLLALKDPKFGEAARWIVLLAALVAIPIYFTGASQEEAFEEGPKEWLVEVHEKIGITTAISLWIWAVMGWLKPAQRVAWIWGLVVLGFLGVAGFYGGLLAHG